MHILSIDQGTTGTTTCLYNQNSELVGKAYKELTQIYPKPGWVEHDPKEIWQSVVETVRSVVSAHPVKILSIGITNQRETVVVWDKSTGQPVYNAICWQCRRTEGICDTLLPHAELIKKKTGLPVDAYFSGTKIKWILDHLKIKNPSNLLVGTIDTWLIWKLTEGSIHATEFTNASRTLLYDISRKKWDSELCGLLDISPSLLPEIKNSMDDFGTVESIKELKGIPITGVAGDQQAALFGQTCFSEGEIKNTYGTGAFVVMNTGDKFISSQKGLITTLAVKGDGTPCFALEGSIFIAGALIQWLRDELMLINSAEETEKAAIQAKDNAGVYIVPAFVGLGAPHWDMAARGTITGLTRGAGKNHLIRAALESMAYQTYDVLSVMEEETGLTIESLSVDGGAVTNDFLMQFQADIINKPVTRPHIIESTSLGAAYLSGLKTGMWDSPEALKKHKRIDITFTPDIEDEKRRLLISGWKKAIRQAKTK